MLPKDRFWVLESRRPGLKEALSHLRETDTLVVWKLDRLGRSVKGLVDLVNELEAQKVHFQSITDGVDTKTPAGRFFFHVMASLAQMERELILERTRAGLEAAQRGTRRGAKAPDERRQGSGRGKATGKRDAATRSGAQPARVGPHVVSVDTGLVTDIRARDGRRSMQLNTFKGFERESGSLSTRNSRVA